MRSRCRRILATLPFVALSPGVAVGQPAKVGIVTTLEGNVTAGRAALPRPVALKFKDDVFFHDTITTGEHSLARVLLGGKSIVTVRERSAVTISEAPGRSFIDLQSGKVGSRWRTSGWSGANRSTSARRPRSSGSAAPWSSRK